MFCLTNGLAATVNEQLDTIRPVCLSNAI